MVVAVAAEMVVAVAMAVGGEEAWVRAAMEMAAAGAAGGAAAARVRRGELQVSAVVSVETAAATEGRAAARRAVAKVAAGMAAAAVGMKVKAVKVKAATWVAGERGTVG